MTQQFYWMKLKLIKLSYILLATISYLGFSCNNDNSSFKVTYYRNNKAYNINLDKNNSEEVYKLFKELAYGTDDMLKLIVTPSRIDDLKKNEELIEVVFDDFIYVDSKIMGEYKAKKILIPLSGDFFGNEQSPMATIFYGENNYSTGPLRNSKGLPLVEKIKNIIKVNIK